MKITVASALGVLAALSVLAPPRPPAAAAAGAPAVSVRVGSFNVQSVSLDRTAGNERPWRTRRASVIRDILGERVDVLGVQEVNPGVSFVPRLVAGATQFTDLRNGLNRAGGHYQLTNAHAFNCVDERTRYRCVYRNRGASEGDRILYNTRTLSLVSQGATRYRVPALGTSATFVAWAVLRVRSTGREFLFATTHLWKGDVGTRRAEWRQLMAQVDRVKGNRPVVVVGDFNTHRLDRLSAQMLPAMRRAGYGDVLNQQYAVTPIRRSRARSTVNGWINSYNHLSRDVRAWSYDDHRDRAGYNIDYVFATNSLPVTQWKVVVHYDPASLLVRGVFPSDHNMVRATLSMR